MITRLRVENFKGFAHLDLPLGRFTVLVGPNGSGKTTILQALDRLSKVAAAKGRGRNSRTAFPRPDLPPETFARKGAARFEVGAEILQDKTSATWLKIVGAPDKEGTWDTTASLRCQPNESDKSASTSEEDLVNVDEPPPALGEFARSALLQLDPRAAATPSYLRDRGTSIDTNGAGLASVLASLHGFDPDAFNDITSALRDIVTHVDRIRFDRVAVTVPEASPGGGNPILDAVAKLTPAELADVVSRLSPAQIASLRSIPGETRVAADVIFFDTTGANGLRADEAGDGTILVLALLTTLLRPPRPTLLLLDDIELGLHPAAQEKLIGVLRKLLERFPDLQIVATSHSPFILDSLSYDEVCQTMLTPGGDAVAGKLVDHPEYERWRELMRPGEFWSTVGEAWLAKREASKK